MTKSNCEPYGLYIHVPFCIKKCEYCDFYSLPYSKELASEYGKALSKELDLIGEKYQRPAIDTVYIGGGTPSLLPKSVLADISECIQKNFNFTNREFTIEVNPATDVDFNFYKDIGINRVSIGVQSLNDRVLKVIGRLHNAQTALATIEKAAEILENVSADLMLGLPFCTLEDIVHNIHTLAPMIKHVSAYILKLSKGVPMAKKVAKGELALLGDDAEADMYDAACEALEKEGLYRYEISNFARIGYESRHNLKYWQHIGYYAAGPAAHSFINGVRYANKPDLKAYLRGENVLTGYGTAEKISENDAIFEEIMLSLRLPQGIDIAKFNAEFNIDFMAQYAVQIERLKNFLIFDGKNLYIKKENFLLESAIAREFLP